MGHLRSHQVADSYQVADRYRVLDGTWRRRAAVSAASVGGSAALFVGLAVSAAVHGVLIAGSMLVDLTGDTRPPSVDFSTGHQSIAVRVVTQPSDWDRDWNELPGELPDPEVAVTTTPIHQAVETAGVESVKPAELDTVSVLAGAPDARAVSFLNPVPAVDHSAGGSTDHAKDRPMNTTIVPSVDQTMGRPIDQTKTPMPGLPDSNPLRPHDQQPPPPGPGVEMTVPSIHARLADEFRLPGGGAPRSVEATPGVESPAEILNLPHPTYPLVSRRLGEQGLVLLEVEVLASGKAGKVKVVQGSDLRRLVESAIRAVHKARFRPATRDGMAVAETVRIPFRFVIK